MNCESNWISNFYLAFRTSNFTYSNQFFNDITRNVHLPYDYNLFHRRQAFTSDSSSQIIIDSTQVMTICSNDTNGIMGWFAVLQYPEIALKLVVALPTSPSSNCSFRCWMNVANICCRESNIWRTDWEMSESICWNAFPLFPLG